MFVYNINNTSDIHTPCPPPLGWLHGAPVASRPGRDAHPRPAQCWASVADTGPALNRPRVNVWPQGLACCSGFPMHRCCFPTAVASPCTAVASSCTAAVAAGKVRKYCGDRNSFNKLLLLYADLLCKVKRQYPLTCKLSRYCPLVLRGPAAVANGAASAVAVAVLSIPILLLRLWYRVFCHC